MTQRYLHKMELHNDLRATSPPEGFVIRPYDKARHHGRIPTLYAAAFDDTPWPSDWDAFPQFNPRGMFVAEVAETGEAAGYAISFQRDDIGYLSVLAVVPAYQRRGIARSLIQAVVCFLRTLDVTSIQVDAYTDSLPAVTLYTSVGFRVIRTYADTKGADADKDEP